MSIKEKIFKNKAKKQKTEREKIEERREEILAQGRKFKYPLQYAKHKMIFYTIMISFFALVVMAILGYLALFKMQMTNDLLYRLTRIIPVPVAEVDAEKVSYSDYLMIYYSSITPIEQQQGKLGEDETSRAMKNHFKRAALTEAETNAYAVKLGRELGVKITDEMIEKEIERHRNAGGIKRSEESFKKILEDNFGMSLNEYKRMIYLSLMKVEVSKKIDTDSEKIVSEIDKKIGSGEDLKKIAEELGDRVIYEETGGLVDRMNIDGGRSTEAMKLEKGKVSGRIVSSSGDGYYFVKLIEKTETAVNYVSIKVPFLEFGKRFKAVKNDGKIKEYIELKDEE